MEDSNEQLKGRADRAEDKLKKGEKPKPPTPPVEKPETPVSEAPQELLSTREMAKLYHEGYSDQEINEVQAAMKAKDLSHADALKDEFVKGGIARLRQGDKVEEATPTPSTRRGPGPIGDKAFKDMDSKEKAEHYSPQAWNARQKNKL